MRVTVIPVAVGALGTVLNGLEKTGGIGSNKKTQNYSDHSIVEISLNTEKSPGDLRRLAITQTPVKDHQLMQM